VSKTVQVYRVESVIGPADVFEALRSVCEEAPGREYAAAFEFEWLSRRLAITATSRDAVEACAGRFLDRMLALTGEAKAFLPSQVTERDDGRFEQAFGVTIQEPAVFAQLIGHTLLEMGMRNVRATETEGVCRVSVPYGGPMSKFVDLESFFLEFPVPAYIRIVKET